NGERPNVGVPLVAGRLLAQIELRFGVGRNRWKVALRHVAALDGRAQPAGGDLLALGRGEPLRSRARDQIAPDGAGCLGERVRREMRGGAEAIGGKRKNAAIAPPHSAAGSTWVSRFFTVTLLASTPFFLRYSEMNHEPVEPTRVAMVLPARSCGLPMLLAATTT